MLLSRLRLLTITLFASAAALPMPAAAQSETSEWQQRVAPGTKSCASF